jgi:hypothetical protein
MRLVTVAMDRDRSFRQFMKRTCNIHPVPRLVSPFSAEWFRIFGTKPRAATARKTKRPFLVLPDGDLFHHFGNIRQK